jgi:hypothetical protein
VFGPRKLDFSVDSEQALNTDEGNIKMPIFMNHTGSAEPLHSKRCINLIDSDRKPLIFTKGNIQVAVYFSSTLNLKAVDWNRPTDVDGKHFNILVMR